MSPMPHGKREPRLQVQPQKRVKAKLDPRFMRLAQQYADLVKISGQGPASKHELMGKEAREEVAALLGRENLPIATFHWFCLMKYHKSYWYLFQKQEQGNLKAAKQLATVYVIYQKWRFRQLQPSDFRFKTEPDHYTLMAGGLGYGFADCSEKQLADWFDDNCSCGKEHSPEALTKLRTRTLKEFKAGKLDAPPLVLTAKRQPGLPLGLPLTIATRRKIERRM